MMCLGKHLNQCHPDRLLGLLSGWKERFLNHRMKILIFLHGTTLMHRNAVGRSRAQRVKQVMDGDKSLPDFASYVPVDNAVQKLLAWTQRGAEIAYLSSQQGAAEVEQDERVLRNYGFPAGQVFFRSGHEAYADVLQRVVPDLLIEDDCESIGGERAMITPHLPPELKATVKSIVVPEFGGIDHLPDDLSELAAC